MKMNKKGFTLIELLAVIVILAIIALIATPIIMGVIDDARQGAAKSSAYGYIDSVEKAMISTANVESGATLTGTYTISNSGAMIINGTESHSVSFKGDKPRKGSLVYTSGSLTGGSITFGNYVFTVLTDGSLSLSK